MQVALEAKSTFGSVDRSTSKEEWWVVFRTVSRSLALRKGAPLYG
jgi:hypothetical protein